MKRILQLMSRTTAVVITTVALLFVSRCANAEFIISGGTVTLVDNAGLTVDDMTLTAGSLVANANEIIVGSSWTRTGGSFSYGTSTVAFTGTGTGLTSALIGSTTFYRIRANNPGTTIRFTAGTTQYVTTRLTLEDVTLRSTINNATWYLVLSGPNQNVNGVNVKDSNASGGNTITATNAFNAGNNTNWSFVVLDTGDRYWVASTAGNWTDSANWSLASGGTGGAQVPLSTHTVIFNSNGNGNLNLNTTINVSTLNIAGYTGIWDSQGNAITITKRFEQTSGTINLRTSTISIQGSFDRSGGNFSAGTSTLTFSGNNNQSLTTGSTGFYHVVVNKTGGSLTLVDELDVLGDITLTAGTFDSGNQAISVAGNWTRTGATYVGDNSNVTFDGTGTSRLTGETTFYGLISDTPSKTLEFSAGTTFYVTNTLDVRYITLKSTVDDSQWHLNMTGPSQTVIDVNVRDSNAGAGQTIGANSASVNSGNNQNWAFGDTYRYWVATTAGVWNSRTNWSLAGGGTGGASVPTSTHTIIFDGSNGANGNANVNTTLNISTIIISGYTGILNSQGFAITISTSFVQDTGSVSIGTSVVTIQGDLLRTGGSFTTGISTIQFTGDKTQTLSPGATAFYHVVVNKTGGSVTLGNDLNLIGQLTITAGTFDTSSTGHYASSSTLLNIQASGIYNANNSTITLTGTSGTLFTEAGTFNQGNSKVTMTPNSAATLTSNNSITFHNLELSPTITIGRTYTLGTNPLTINGDFDINPTAASSLGLTVNLGSTTVVGGMTTVQGTGAASSNLTTTGSNRTFTTGNLSIISASTFTANASLIVLNGTTGPLLSRSGAFTQGTSTVDIESDADVTITNDVVTFNNLTMTSTITANRSYTFGPGGITISGSWTINPVKSDAGNAILEIDLGAGTTVAAAGTLTISGTTNASSLVDTTVSNHALSAGKINIGANGTLRGNASTITLTGTTSTLFTNTGSFEPGTSTVIMNPDAAVTLTSGFLTFGHLTLSPTITLARAYTFGGSSLTINGNFNINPNAGSALGFTVNLGSTTVVGGTTTVTRTASATSNLTTTASNHPFTSGIIDLRTGGTLTGNASTITLNSSTGPLLAMNGGTYTVGTSTLNIDSDADVTLTSGTVTLNNLTMTSTITANRVYTFGTTAIQINGSWNINPVKSDAGDAILQINLAAGTTVAAAGTLTINGTTNASSLVNTTVSNHALSAGKINIGSNGTLRGNGSNITLTGTTSTLFTNTGQFEPGTSDVRITPDAAVTLTSGFFTFNNLTLAPTITAGRAYTFGGSSLTINNMFNINPTAGTAQALTVNLASTTVVGATTTITRTTSATSNLTTTVSNYPFATANLNVATGGTFTANGSSVTLTGTTSPLITRAGTFTQGTSTVTVVSAASVVLNSGTLTFSHLYIDTPLQTISLGAAPTVSGVLTINDGTLADAGFQITGNATNRFVMAAGTEFKIGSAATATTFPTNFTAANISFALGSTVTYNAGVVQAISGTPSYAHLNLVAPSGTPTKTPGAAVTVRGDLTIGASNTYSNGALSLTIGGNYTNNGTFTASTGSTTFNSTGAGNTLAGTLTGTSQFNNLVFNGIGGEWTPTSTLTVASTLTVTAGTLSGSNDITVIGGVIGDGTNGLINLTGGTFAQRVAANQLFGSNAAGSNNWTFNNLTFSNSSAANRTITTASGGTGRIVVNGNLSVGQSGDTFATILNNQTNNRSIAANGNVSILTLGRLQASASQPLVVKGDWDNLGTFTTNNSTVTFEGSSVQTINNYGKAFAHIISSNTSSGGLVFSSSFSATRLFINTSGLSSSATMYFAGRSTFTISTFTVNGTSIYPVVLKSTTTAVWYLNNTSTSSITFANVQYSSASLGQFIQAQSSFDNGNNTHWDFGSPNAVTNLTALVSSVGRTIDLSWTAPGDDGSIGTLNSSTFTIQYTTDTTFGHSSSWGPTAGGMPAYVYRIHIATNNVNPGSTQNYRVTGLLDGATYFFRLWTKDHLGNYSSISNGATNYALDQILSLSLSWSTLSLPESIDLNTSLVISTSVLVTNDGNVEETFEFRATTATAGSPWTIQPTQGTDQFVLWAISNPTEPTSGNFGNEDRLGETNLRCTATVLSNGSSTCVSVPPGESRTIWFKLGMPTLTTTGMSQEIRITGTATVPD